MYYGARQIRVKIYADPYPSPAIPEADPTNHHSSFQTRETTINLKNFKQYQ
jgi:hypothetical protein